MEVVSLGILGSGLGKNQASFMHENVLLCILVKFNEHEVRVFGKRNVHNGILGA